MPTSNERRALWFLAMVALSGSVVRVLRARSTVAPAIPNEHLEWQLGRVDSARAKRGAPKRAKARTDSPITRARGPVDLDQATSAEIEALPGIGPALAARIIAHRDSAGLFGSAAAFCKVKGVGPATFRKLRAEATFSGVPASTDSCEVVSSRPSKSHVTNRRKRP